MRVQRVLMPGSEAESWTLFGDDQVPVEPVEEFLAYLASIEKSPNTIKAYAHDLKDWLAYLGGREIVGQVFPGDPGPVHIQDRVHDLAQVMDGLAEAQASLGPRRPPAGHDRLDQCPAGIGQVAAVRTTGGHDSDL